MVAGFLLALLAGTMVGMQNLFNAKVNESVSGWTTTVLVLGTGFAASLTMGLLFEGAALFNLEGMRTWHWFSGLIGVGVVVCLVQGLRRLGPTFAVSIMMTSQLGFALLWDSFGWLGLERVPFSPTKAIGALVIVGGIVVFKIGGLLGKEREVE